MTIPAATTAVHYSAASGDPKQARAELYALQQAFEQTRSFVGGSMGSLTATDAGALDVDSVDAGTIYVAAQAGSPSPVVSDLGTPTRGAPWKTLVFEGGITLTHAAGSLELPGGADILTEDNDSAVVVYDTVGSPAFWRVISYQRAADRPGRVVLLPSVATTSGTSVDLSTSIPSGINQITVMFDGVSQSGTDNLLIQIGDSGGFETSGYASDYLLTTEAPTNSQDTSTAGFFIRSNGATSSLSGSVTLTRISGNKWVAFGGMIRTAGSTAVFTFGSKELSAEIDRIRIASTGSDTFDAGSAAVSYQ